MLINFLYNLNQCLYISLFTHVTLSCGVMLLSIVMHISTIVSSGARAFASVLFSNKNTKCISLFLSSLLEANPYGLHYLTPLMSDLVENCDVHLEFSKSLPLINLLTYGKLN